MSAAGTTVGWLFASCWVAGAVSVVLGVSERRETRMTPAEMAAAATTPITTFAVTDESQPVWAAEWAAPAALPPAAMLAAN